MTKTLSFVAAAMLCAIATQSFGQNKSFQPVTLAARNLVDPVSVRRRASA